ncbi:MAG TPA: DUF86 domain-containing protein [Verrucomicrobiota bacterium]|nr:DUF86 domain-containing protein [Verrucomicrobiota bacterium]
MDPSITLAKLDSLRRCLRRVEARRPATVAALQEDFDAQDIISLNLERAVQQCVDLASMRLADTDDPPPANMREAFDLLVRAGVLSHDVAERLKAAVGLRNILVHEYRRVDWAIVLQVIHHHLGDFEEFARQVAPGLLPPPPPAAGA